MVIRSGVLQHTVKNLLGILICAEHSHEADDVKDDKCFIQIYKVTEPLRNHMGLQFSL